MGQNLKTILLVALVSYITIAAANRVVQLRMWLGTDGGLGDS